MEFDAIDDKEFEFSNVGWTVKLAHAAYQAEKFQEAENLYAEALKVIDLDFGDEHPDLPLALWNYGNTLYSLSKFREAIPLYNRLAQIQEDKLGKYDTKVVAHAIQTGYCL